MRITNPKILAIDDTPENLMLLGAIAKNLDWQMTFATSGPEALEFVEHKIPDLILLDIMMPIMDGFEVLKRLKASEKTKDIPVIFITAKTDPITIVKVFEQGAQDHIPKPFNKTELVARVEGHLREKALKTELNLKVALLEAANSRLDQMASIDALTNLQNRRSIFASLSEAIANSKRYETSLCIMMLDIDHFKAVNDTYGHQRGDEVLVEIAKVISNNIREVDRAGRYGGEEFLVIFPSTGLEGAFQAAEKIRSTVESLQWAEPDLKTAISGGLAIYTGQKELEFVGAADENLYKAKESGRNKIVGP
ncbi:MAG: diguanylate cyclase [SAR324 cluster bacterium]|nr:diguanylate cyclase [SAR324 cluster bacterium]